MSSGALSPINRGLARVARRADQKSDEHLRRTFVDSGVTAALEIEDHQVLFGRRGTGKTHAFRYIQGEIEGAGGVAIYIDLRTVGSPEGLFGGGELPITERTARLLVDLLGQVHEAILGAILDDDELLGNAALVNGLDALVDGITELRVDVTEVEREKTDTATATAASGLSVELSVKPSAKLELRSDETAAASNVRRELRKGPERLQISFGAVADALRVISAELRGRRLWLLID